LHQDHGAHTSAHVELDLIEGSGHEALSRGNAVTNILCLSAFTTCCLGDYQSDRSRFSGFPVPMRQFFLFPLLFFIFYKSELSLWSLRLGRTCAFSSSFEGYIPARVDLFWTTGGRWSHRTCMAFTVGGRPSGALSTGLAMEKDRGFRLSFMILGKWRAPTRGGGLWTNYLRAPGSDNDFG